MCNFNFNRICQNISRAAGVVSPATLSGTRQPQKSGASCPHLPCTHVHTSPASHPRLPCSHAYPGWQCLDKSRLGSAGFMFTSMSLFLRPRFRGHGCLGSLSSGISSGCLFNCPVTPAHMSLARGCTRPGPASAGCRTRHLPAIAQF